MSTKLEHVLHMLIDRTHFASESQRNDAHADINEHFAKSTSETEEPSEDNDEKRLF